MLVILYSLFINNIDNYTTKPESFENSLYLVYKMDKLRKTNVINKSEFCLCILYLINS